MTQGSWKAGQQGRCTVVVPRLAQPEKNPQKTFLWGKEARGELFSYQDSDNVPMNFQKGKKKRKDFVTLMCLSCKSSSP